MSDRNLEQRIVTLFKQKQDHNIGAHSLFGRSGAVRLFFCSRMLKYTSKGNGLRTWRSLVTTRGSG
jgi:hypothetical protein